MYSTEDWDILGVSEKSCWGIGMTYIHESIHGMEKSETQVGISQRLLQSWLCAFGRSTYAQTVFELSTNILEDFRSYWRYRFFYAAFEMLHISDGLVKEI